LYTPDENKYSCDFIAIAENSPVKISTLQAENRNIFKLKTLFSAAFSSIISKVY